MTPQIRARLAPCLAFSLLLFSATRPAAAQAPQAIYDTRTGQVVTQPAMLDALAQADVVFVGEQHDDAATHALELQVLTALHERAGARLALAMEMFERDTQPALDGYVAGKTDEAAFRKASRPWTNYQTDYRPLIEYAKSRHIPVVASNAPEKYVSLVQRGGLAALKAAPPGLAVAPDMTPHDAYWARFHSLMTQMGGAHGGMAMGEPDIARLFQAQSVWDATMADSVVRALDARPDALVLHVNGQFHSDGGGGIPKRVLWARPLTRVRIVSVVPVPHLPTALPDADRTRGDYVLYLQVQ